MIGDIVSRLTAVKDFDRVTLLDRLQAANSTITGINYMYGHPTELVSRLQLRTQDDGDLDSQTGGKWDMWPVVMLFTDFPETMDNTGGGYFQTVTLQIVIAMITERNLFAEQRLNINFKPILQPIYEALMQSIMRSAYFVVQSQKQIRHTKYDRYFWGKTGLYGNSGNMFNDHIDAIEIQNLTLRVNN